MSISFIISAFVAGLFMFLAPCTLPLVPGYLAFISGVSLQDLNDQATAQKNRRNIFCNGIYFVLGFSCVFILFGAFAGFIGSILGPLHIWLSRIGGLFVFFSGLFMLNVLTIPFLNREKRLRIPALFERGKPINSFLLGSAFALGWTPCVGPILGTILLLASTSVSVLSGTFLLAIFSAGLAIPFLIIAASVGSASQYISRFRRLLAVISVVGGIFLMLLGILLMFGNGSMILSYGYRFFAPFGRGFFLDYL